MNDPHVVALIYRVRHHESVDYGKAEPLKHEADGFRVVVEDGTARFEMKQHHATAAEARDVIEPFIRDWEFDACFGHRHEHFHLDFDRPEIIDRSPTTGVVSLSAHARSGPATASARLVVGHRRYPPPPTKIDSRHPDVRTLYERYKGFRAGNEPLEGFAYFCLTVLEHSVGSSTSRNGRPGRRRVQAAETYEIDLDVLRHIGELSSTKGGRTARKAGGRGTPLTDDERRFLTNAIVKLIRRVAEYHGGNGGLPQITMAEF